MLYGPPADRDDKISTPKHFCRNVCKNRTQLKNKKQNKNVNVLHKRAVTFISIEAGLSPTFPPLASLEGVCRTSQQPVERCNATPIMVRRFSRTEGRHSPQWFSVSPRTNLTEHLSPETWMAPLLCARLRLPSRCSLTPPTSSPCCLRRVWDPQGEMDQFLLYLQHLGHKDNCPPVWLLKAENSILLSRNASAVLWWLLLSFKEKELRAADKV